MGSSVSRSTSRTSRGRSATARNSVKIRAVEPYHSTALQYSASFVRALRILHYVPRSVISANVKLALL